MPYSKSSTLSIDEHVYLNEDSKSSEVVVENDKEAFIDLVGKGLTKIEEGVFNKVVLSRKEKVQLGEIDPIHYFKVLLNSYNNALVYCWYHPSVGLWLGATPELLLDVKGHSFSTMALAGTQLYEGTLDVKWNAKEQQEQQFVTDYIESEILEYTMNVNVYEPATVRAGHVLHLKTDIKGEIRPESESFRKLLLAIHPTPAVCGMPKVEAMQFILDYEGYNREFYTGFLGELNKEMKIEKRANAEDVVLPEGEKRASHLFVNLRCMQLNKNEAFVYVGCGITKDSIPEQEWNETVNKTKTIKRVIAF